MSVKCQYLPSIETFFWYFVWCLSRQVFEVILTRKTVTSHGKACIEISYPLCAEGDHSVALFSYIAVIGDL